MTRLIEQFVRSVLAERRAIPLDRKKVIELTQGFKDRIEQWALSVPEEQRDLTLKQWRSLPENTGKWIFPNTGIGVWNLNTIDGRNAHVTLSLNAVDGKSPSKFISGGAVGSFSITHVGSKKKPGPREPNKLEIRLNLNRTPNEILRYLNSQIHRELHHVIIHEMTHAQDRLSHPYSQFSASDDLEGYHNRPHEVRAFMQQIVDEISGPFMYDVHLHRDELKDKSEPTWAKAIGQQLKSADAIDRYLRKSDTWSNRHRYWTPDNQRKIRQAVATRVSELWDEIVSPIISTTLRKAKNEQQQWDEAISTLLESTDEKQGQSAAIILMRDGMILLLRRGMTAPWMPGKWNLPGGEVDPGETPKDAARREAQEEAAVTPGKMSLVGTVDMGSDGMLHVFSARDFEGEPKYNWESMDMAWVDPEEAMSMDLVPGIRDTIARLTLV